MPVQDSKFGPLLAGTHPCEQGTNVGVTYAGRSTSPMHAVHLGDVGVVVDWEDRNKTLLVWFPHPNKECPSIENGECVHLFKGEELVKLTPLSKQAKQGIQAQVGNMQFSECDLLMEHSLTEYACLGLTCEAIGGEE